MHFASLYRWIVATQHWQLPRSFSGAVLDIGADDEGFLARITADWKLGIDLRRPAEMVACFAQADATELPFVSGVFDHVFAFDILEHVVHDDLLLLESLRVLAPGGTLWLSTTSDSFAVFPGGGLQKRLQQSWGHVRRGYSPGELVGKFPEGVDVDVYSWNEPWFRFTYLGLWLFAQKWPNRVASLIPSIVAADGLMSRGHRGHIFLRIIKTEDA